VWVLAPGPALARALALVCCVGARVLGAPPASAAPPAGSNSPDWVPYVGARHVWCTMSNPGWAGCHGHHGYPAIDIGMAVGTTVVAAGPGTVHEVETDDVGSSGRFVAVAHPDGTYSRYLHLSRVDVSAGQGVERGQPLGLSGSSGSSTSPHLHYDEQKPYGTRVDPGPMLSLVDGKLVKYPDAFGHSTWWTVPYGSLVANDAFPYLFLDVPTLHPFLPEIEWLVDAGITTGFPDGTFRSFDAVSRQAMAAFLYRLAGSPAGPFPDPGFTDVPTHHLFFDEIAWMAATGLTTGYPDGRFGVFDPVTRQAAGAFLYRVAGSPSGPFVDPGFHDVPSDHPFFVELSWLATTGITTGFPDGSFQAASSVTRQAAAAFLYRYAT
jgi:hypothetical protein